MPTTQLSRQAAENGTYIIDCAFADEDGTAVVPTSIVWSLMDLSGNVINNRQNVSVVPESSITIVLTGDDLEINESIEAGLGRRMVLVEWVYDSTLGSGLPGKDAAFFEVVDLLSL